MTFETRLISTDGSDPAEAAAGRGFDLAARLEATVHVLSVVDRSIVTSATYVGESPTICERLREEAREHVASLEREARKQGLDVVSAVREGISAGETVDYADNVDADAIVMGTHGRGRFQRLIVGSVADKVVRTASVPVMSVQPTAASETNE